MRTTHLINQHKKCECILEMIIKADSYLNIAKANLSKYMATPVNIRWTKYIFADQAAFERVVARQEAIKSRLEKYYKANVEKIESVVEYA